MSTENKKHRSVYHYHDTCKTNFPDVVYNLAMDSSIGIHPAFYIACVLQIFICYLLLYLQVYESYIWNMHNFVTNCTVHGALRCLALLSGDLDDKVVPTLVPVLFPCLLTIVSSTQVCFCFYTLYKRIWRRK